MDHPGDSTGAPKNPHTEIQTFHFEGTPFRVLDEEGDWWFIAADAAKPLGHRDANKITRILDADERGTRIVGTPSGQQEVSVISEPGLYRAIMQRRVTKALTPEMKAAIERFQRWVYHDVLPSIRKNGAYVHEGVNVAGLDAATRKILGGMIKSNAGVVVREALAPVQAELAEAKQEIAVLRDKIESPATCSANDLWAEEKFPALKGGTVWLGNRLIEMGCLPEFGSRSKLGGRWRRLFDAGRARAAMKNGLKLLTERYISERKGQRTFDLGGTKK